MLPQRVGDRFTDYGAQAQDCQHTADLFPEDHIGQEFAELARRWRLVAFFAEGINMNPRLAAGSLGADRMAFLGAIVGSIGTVISIALVMWLATIVAF